MHYTTLIVLVLAYVLPGQALAHEAVGPGAEMSELYHKGKVEEARSRFDKEFKELTHAAGKPFEPRRPLDAESHVSSVSVAANVLTVALKEERRHIKSSRAPENILAQVEKTMKLLDKVKSDIEGSQFKDNQRVERVLDNAMSQRTALLTSAILLNRDLGRLDEAKRIIKEHESFLRQQGVPIDAFVPDDTDGNEKVKPVAADRTWETSGEVLPISNLLYSYYRALSNENEKELDSVLAGGDNYLNGKQLLMRLANEKRSVRDIDKLLMPVIDQETKLIVKHISDDVYSVQLTGVIKRVVLNGKTITQRESDHFMVRRDKNHDYRIIIEKGARDES